MYGKERGGDIAEGKRTLILIDLLRKCSAAEAAEVLEVLHQDRQHTSQAQIERVISLVERYGCMAFAEGVCRQQAERSLGHLEALPATEARELLREMLEFLVQRAF